MRTLQFLDYHRHHLNRKTFESCTWVDKGQGIFKVLWPKASKNTEPEKLGIMFDWWKLRMGNTKQYDEPTLIKNNYRSALNSKTSSKSKQRPLRRRKDLESNGGTDHFWRYLQFVGGGDEHDEEDTGTITTDQEEMVARFDPGHVYAEVVLNEELCEVKRGNLKWEITVKAFTKRSLRLWEYTYDYLAEDQGKRKLLVYVNGNRAKDLGKKLENSIQDLDHRTLNLSKPIEPTHEIFREEFSNGRNPQQKFTRQDTFCPGFILEVDQCFNVYVTRLSLAKLYYGHHGVQNEWQNLERPIDGKRYLDSMESEDGVKQMVFSYKKFIHGTRIYENWLSQDNCKPEISLMDSTVVMPVDICPAVGKGCNEGSAFYFEIEHKPATRIHRRIKSLEEGQTPSIFLSDPLTDILPATQRLTVNPAENLYPRENGINHEQPTSTNLTYFNTFPPTQHAVYQANTNEPYAVNYDEVCGFCGCAICICC